MGYSDHLYRKPKVALTDRNSNTANVASSISVAAANDL